MKLPWICLLWLLLAAHAAVGADAVLKNDFAQDPLAQGWELRGLPNQPFDGAWADVEGQQGNRCLIVRRGWWQSPPVTVQPLQYYRLRFSAKVDGPGHWAAVFLDAAGKEIAADDYDNVYPAADWQTQTFCLRAHPLAVHVRLRFQAFEKPLAIDDVSLEAVDAETVAAWADEVVAGCPLVQYEPPANRWQRLPADDWRTLREGGRLRVVMLGDSICNDTSNSLFETLLARVYPKTRIEVVTSVRGGTGCQYYRQEDRVREYVLRYKPDLVVIAGISHGFDAEAFPR